ncbi:vacuolar protein sorting-associated protein [Perkinsela sp. CCAP 1560/4]|nr:vacuolar protein sorting-associated protein [Perkinsela sp. CCAP 1560/4]|eukprot:KNH03777.1 vacuolar protein sorting-associated protein [Perkinsela sp. CCAP 1560/4]
MDIRAASREYVAFMLRSVSGPKALLVDEVTTGYLSLVYTQSEMALGDVYLIDPLESSGKREPLVEFACLIYVRPTQRNVALLSKELQNPCFGAYYIYFTGPISRRDIEVLAESDKEMLVRDIRELFSDFYALKPNLFTTKTHLCSIGSRVVDGIISALGALKRYPTEIRYQGNSNLCSKLVNSLGGAIDSNRDIFLSKRSKNTEIHGCSLLLIDRTEDPFTPLLTPWTYEAMIHEFLGFDLNSIVLDKSGDAAARKHPEENQIVFNTIHDDFYREHLNSDWGTVCVAARKMVEGYQSSIDEKSGATKSDTADFDDLRDRISRIPMLQRQAANVKKHVNVTTEIGKQIRYRDLFSLGAFEQEVMRVHAPKEHWRTFCEILKSHKSMKTNDIARLALLFILRYENEDARSLTGEKSGFAKSALYTLSGGSPTSSSKRESPTTSSMVLNVLREHNLGHVLSTERVQRFVDRYGSYARCMNTLPKGSDNILKTVFGAVKSVGGDHEQSWYTQHEPFVLNIVKLLVEDALPAEHFPTYHSELANTEAFFDETESKDVIIFVTGGVTFTEARVLEEISSEWTKKHSGRKTAFEFFSVGDSKSASKKKIRAPRVIIGSTDVITSSTFLEEC